MDSTSVKLYQRKALITRQDELYKLYLKEKERSRAEALKAKTEAKRGLKWKKANEISESQNKLLRESLESQKAETKKARRSGLLWFVGGIGVGATAAAVLVLTN